MPSQKPPLYARADVIISPIVLMFHIDDLSVSDAKAYQLQVQGMARHGFASGNLPV
jgi:hypothetical protein